MTTSTVCLIAKNEERGILEWIAYQRAVGFDRIIIYDNDSDDRTAELIQIAQRNDSAISYVYWPNEPGKRPQLTAYADATGKCETDWLAYFDTDEFIVLHEDNSINEYIARVGSKASAIMLNWLVFGSSGHTFADSRLVIERFTRCAMPNHGKNLIGKSIVRPQDVKEVGVHSVVLKHGCYVNASGHPLTLEPHFPKTLVVDHKVAQLNHYLLKSREEYQQKVARGHASRAMDDKAKQHIVDAEEFWQAHDLNQRVETIILDSHLSGVQDAMAFLSR